MCCSSPDSEVSNVAYVNQPSILKIRLDLNTETISSVCFAHIGSHQELLVMQDTQESLISLHKDPQIPSSKCVRFVRKATSNHIVKEMCRAHISRTCFEV